MSEYIKKSTPEEAFGPIDSDDASFSGPPTSVSPISNAGRPLPTPQIKVVNVSSDSKNMLQAKQVLGQDFMGVDAIRVMESKLGQVGVDVRFVLDPLPTFPYNDKDLQFAVSQGEMAVFRPSWMMRGGQMMPVNLRNFQDLFQVDPIGKLTNVFNPNQYKWYQQFTKEQMDFSWKLVKKDPVSDSHINDSDPRSSVAFEKKLKYLGGKNAVMRRRSALEVIYDTLLYYTNTGEIVTQGYETSRTIVTASDDLANYNPLEVETRSYGISILRRHYNARTLFRPQR